MSGEPIEEPEKDREKLKETETKKQIVTEDVIRFQGQEKYIDVKGFLGSIYVITDKRITRLVRVPKNYNNEKEQLI